MTYELKTKYEKQTPAEKKCYDIAFDDNSHKYQQ